MNFYRILVKEISNDKKDRAFFQHHSGDLVYIISPLMRQLHTASRKVFIRYVHPIVIYKLEDPHNYLLMTFHGKFLRGLFEHKRLKPAILRISKGNINNLSQLKQVINIGLSATF